MNARSRPLMPADPYVALVVKTQIDLSIVRNISYNFLMSWNDAKNTVLACLKEGRIQHELRGNIDRKNLFATGEVSREAVCELLTRARGNEHNESPHHLDRNITVHLVKRKGWYIKWYFVEPDAVFISVHREEKA